MRFRPCIDLHEGRVKQIVGGTLRDGAGAVTNYVSDLGPAHFAALYRRDGLEGGHVIQLGPGNEAAAREALAAYPGGLQLGGGVTAATAAAWLECGAAKVIVTSFVFTRDGVRFDRLAELVRAVGRERLVLDLSCRRSAAGGYRVAVDRWQTLTEVAVDAAAFAALAPYTAEFLVHAVDVEGRQAGIDAELVELLAAASPLPVTYAGGVRTLADLDVIAELGAGRVDATVGSALDLFGGSGIRYAELVAWDQRQRKAGR
jgi:phosphoribosylformimino-5-aminoimidazole carboxamide ribotide isomerase